MNTITQFELRELANLRQFPCVSMYLPIARGGVEGRQNMVVLRDALRSAEAILLEQGHSVEQAADVLKDVGQLLDDPMFWAHPGDGLAVFTAAGRQWTYHLPLPFTKAIYVDDHFIVGPLIPALRSTAKFLVLALSENAPALYVAAGEEFRRVAANLPAGMRRDLGYDEPEAQIHAISGARFRDRKEGSVFHGQGASTKHKDADMHAYCRDVCAALAPILAQQRAPVVVVATDRLAAIFGEECADPHLTPTHVSGCPDHWSEDELHERARAVFNAHQLQRDRADVQRISELVGAGRAVVQPETVLRAACSGQVNALFVTRGAELRGRFQQITGAVHLAPRGSDGDDLLETIVQETLRHGGAVRSVEAGLLTGAPIAALLRYAVT